MDGAKNVEALFAPHGANRWVNQVSFSGPDSVSEVLVDAEGNPIIAGTIDSGEGSDLYVVKYARDDGEIVWETRVTTPSTETFGGIAVDAEGNVYAAVAVKGIEPFNINGVEITPDILGDIVVTRLDSTTGSIDWVVEWEGYAQDQAADLIVSEGDLFVAGETGGDARFGSQQLAASGGFLVKAALDDGGVSRAKALDGEIAITAIAAGNGHIAVAGRFLSTMAIDDCVLNISGDGASDGLLAEFDRATLECRWDETFGDSDADLDLSTSANAVAAYPGGGWVVTGSFGGSVSFGGAFISPQDGSDAFVARYDEGGEHVWSFGYGGPGLDRGTGVSVTTEGRTILVGTFSSEITFGTFQFGGDRDVFVTRMSAGDAPVHEWAVALGGANSDAAEGVAVDDSGWIYALARFTGMTDVGGVGLTARDYDAFLAALVR